MDSLWGIPADHWDNYAERVRPFLQHFAARSHGRWDASRLEGDILKRERQIWVFGDFQMCLMTHVEPEGIYLDACAGRQRGDWVDAVDEAMRDWAQKLGKKRIFSLCRPGWAREAKKRGFREIHREMVLEI